MAEADPTRHDARDAYFTSSLWGGVFFVLGAVILIAVGLSVGLILGFSAASDRVFAIEGLLAGLGAALLIRWQFNRRLELAPWLPVPLPFIWALLCLYVFVMRPFESPP